MRDGRAIEPYRDPFQFDSRVDRTHRRPVLRDRRFTRRDKWSVRRDPVGGRWEAGPTAEHVFINLELQIRAVQFPTWAAAFTYAFFKSQEDA